MFLRRLHTDAPQEIVLNVIPFVDILFLLIIFFILASRFAASEAFTVQVPDAIEQARVAKTSEGSATITLMSSSGVTTCAIGSEVIPSLDKTVLVEKLSSALDQRLEFFPPDKRIVALRIDKHVPYKDTQYILAAVARSKASAVHLVAIREKM
jgi:biopolymer transport protein ExbD